MKKMIATAFIAACFSIPALAQDSKMQGDKMKLKDHKCTAACTKDKHVYAHGEKGHVCTAACKKMDKKMDKKSDSKM
ncbi:MAG: hypothetical protein C0459_02275 [Chitinophaga sp.]|jgi:Zn finger protein HypA/HybF involved in hydrogenase expression|nr:hypothetical protein [Chitinophaga sp.]